jgi:hypothetical protein
MDVAVQEAEKHRKFLLILVESSEKKLAVKQ